MFDPFAPRRNPLMAMIPIDRTTEWICKWLHKNRWTEDVTYVGKTAGYYCYMFDHDENLSGFKFVPRECDADGWDGIIIIDIYPK